MRNDMDAKRFNLAARLEDWRTIATATQHIKHPGLDEIRAGNGMPVGHIGIIFARETGRRKQPLKPVMDVTVSYPVSNPPAASEELEALGFDAFQMVMDFMEASHKRINWDLFRFSSDPVRYYSHGDLPIMQAQHGTAMIARYANLGFANSLKTIKLMPTSRHDDEICKAAVANLSTIEFRKV